jgi:energy-coupling factor transporter ATP-binding protein EcfA2
MITRIELSNFMSHVHTVIEPAAGLTVLVGPNNCGKSAFVAALQILSHNENSTYVLRHGTKECFVKVTTDDGHAIEWRRKKSTSYVVDGQVFDRLRVNQVPDELVRALRLPLVDDGSGNDPFDVHFGEQKSPIFLLDRPPSAAARFFASSSDAIRLVQMQKRHKDKLAQRQRDKNRLEAESQQLTAELDALQPATEVDERLRNVEQLQVTLRSEHARLGEAERDLAALTRQIDAVVLLEANESVLASLTTPPVLVPEAPLTEHLTALERAESDVARQDANCAALARLSVPPALGDERELAAVADRIAELVQVDDRESSAQRALHSLSHPPMLPETRELAGLVERLAAAEQALTLGGARHDALTELQTPPTLGDEQQLNDVIFQLAAAQRRAEHWATVSSCSVLPPLVQSADDVPLAQCVVQLESAAALAGQLAAEFAVAAEELRVAETQLREFAATETCPTCGGTLDADRLLAGAAAITGGHAHG